MPVEELNVMAREAEEMLRGNILGFWLDRMTDPAGGFYGRIDGQGNVHADAPRGCVLYARILWTFSAAYRTTGEVRYKEAANRAKAWFIEHFTDPVYGGVYWSVDANGCQPDTKKQFYALGFAIYGLSEHHRATGDDDSLRRAIALFETVERYSRDPLHGGYIEACTRDWSPLGDMRLSAKDANEKKTMNTHLHILEPYTNLYRVWKEPRLRESLRELVGVFLEKIYRPATGHLGLFFDERWNLRDSARSYGHDIEAAWLLWEAVDVLDYAELKEAALPVIAHIARAAAEGLQPDGSMIYETHHDGAVDSDRHWWVQAETVVGYLYMYIHMGDEAALGKALRCWDYLRANLVDLQGGEWWWSITGDGARNTADDKAGFWKCPYHNGRMCMEIMSLARV